MQQQTEQAQVFFFLSKILIDKFPSDALECFYANPCKFQYEHVQPLQHALAIEPLQSYVLPWHAPKSRRTKSRNESNADTKYGWHELPNKYDRSSSIDQHERLWHSAPPGIRIPWK